MLSSSQAFKKISGAGLLRLTISPHIIRSKYSITPASRSSSVTTCCLVEEARAIFLSCSFKKVRSSLTPGFIGSLPPSYLEWNIADDSLAYSSYGKSAPYRLSMISRVRTMVVPVHARIAFSISGILWREATSFQHCITARSESNITPSISKTTALYNIFLFMENTNLSLSL